MNRKPNIITPFDNKKRFKDLVLNVISDSSIYTMNVDTLSVNDNLFTLTLLNKKFVFEDIKVDNLQDYIDVYLQGIKMPSNVYTVTDDGTNIIINFTEDVTRVPNEILVDDFSVKGKIVSR